MQEERDPFDIDVESTRDEAEALRISNRRKQFISDLKDVMASKPGRKLLSEMLKKAGVFGGGFIENERAMYFREGERNAGLRLLNDMMEADNSAYIKMLTEDNE